MTLLKNIDDGAYVVAGIFTIALLIFSIVATTQWSKSHNLTTKHITNCVASVTKTLQHKPHNQILISSALCNPNLKARFNIPHHKTPNTPPNNTKHTTKHPHYSSPPQ